MILWGALRFAQSGLHIAVVVLRFVCCGVYVVVEVYVVAQISCVCVVVCIFNYVSAYNTHPNT